MRRQGSCDETIKTSILDSWARAGAEASAAGTVMHRQIELFLNGRCSVALTGELEQFNRWLVEEAAPRGWVPYRSHYLLLALSKLS